MSPLLSALTASEPAVRRVAAEALGRIGDKRAVPPLLAASRGGIRLVLIPHENVKDLADIPDNVKAELQIEPVRWIEDVLRLALERMPERRDADAPAPVSGAAPEVARPH